MNYTLQIMSSNYFQFTEKKKPSSNVNSSLKGTVFHPIQIHDHLEISDYHQYIFISSQSQGQSTDCGLTKTENLETKNNNKLTTYLEQIIKQCNYQCIQKEVSSLSVLKSQLKKVKIQRKIDYRYKKDLIKSSIKEQPQKLEKKPIQYFQKTKDNQSSNDKSRKNYNKRQKLSGQNSRKRLQSRKIPKLSSRNILQNQFASIPSLLINPKEKKMFFKSRVASLLSRQVVGFE